jgi:transposase-like protein
MTASGALTPKQERAVHALLTEATIERAAAKVGVNESTLRRWRRDVPAFRAAELAARRQLVEAAQAVVQQLTTTAALALHRNLTCGRPAVEVRAAAVVFDLAGRAVEMQELLARVESLEQQLKERP